MAEGGRRAEKTRVGLVAQSKSISKPAISHPGECRTHSVQEAPRRAISGLGSGLEGKCGCRRGLWGWVDGKFVQNRVVRCSRVCPVAALGCCLLLLHIGFALEANFLLYFNRLFIPSSNVWTKKKNKQTHKTTEKQNCPALRLISKPGKKLLLSSFSSFSLPLFLPSSFFLSSYSGF